MELILLKICNFVISISIGHACALRTHCMISLRWSLQCFLIAPGLQVLGTFITEWGLGAQRCARLFQDPAAAQTVADQLVAISKHYGFEGWLINMENRLSDHGVEMMLHFLGYLRARLHAEVPHGTVIW